MQIQETQIERILKAIHTLSSPGLLSFGLDCLLKVEVKTEMVTHRKLYLSRRTLGWPLSHPNTQTLSPDLTVALLEAQDSEATHWNHP